MKVEEAEEVADNMMVCKTGRLNGKPCGCRNVTRRLTVGIK